MESEHVSPEEESNDPAPVASVDDAPAAEPSEDPDGPSVDELEGRLGDVEQAMAQIQSGQLDEAEASIASLDQRIGSASD